MSCQYEYYKENEEAYFPRLYCSIDDKTCIYSKKCLKVNKFISTENQGECYKMIEEKIKQIPKGSYFVETYRPNKNNKLFLYVIIEDKVEKILSDLEELNQDYVYLKKEENNYKVSLVPFPTEKIEKKVAEKKTYNRKNYKSERKENEK